MAPLLPATLLCAAPAEVEAAASHEMKERAAGVPRGDRLQPLLSVPVLRSEAVMLCAHLEPEDVAQLICVSSSGATCEDREALWHAYFTIRWGREIRTTRSTVVRILHSWFDEARPCPRILSVGFSGARSAFDHLFWFLPYVRHAFRVDHALRCSSSGLQPCGDRPAKRRAARAGPGLDQTSQLQAWQFACRAQSRRRVVVHCYICDVLEVAPPGPLPCHFRRHWARPCACSARSAHVTCLEQQLLQLPAKPAARTGCSGATLSCSFCGRNYRTSMRFPETFTELIRATIREWRWVLRRFLMTCMFYVWLYSLASHYCGDVGMPGEMRALLLMTAAMMGISLSPRLHRGVQKIWNTPNRYIYFQLFGLFAVQNYLVSLRALEPSMWLATANRGPWLAAVHRLHSLIHETVVGSALLSLMSGLYIFTASGIIFCFWKTAVRVPTIADAEDAPLVDMSTPSVDGPVRPRFATCGLCQLGLCLDNTCM